MQKERESVLKIFFVTVIITDNVGHGNSVYPPPVINKIALCGGIIALHMGTRIQENHDIYRRYPLDLFIIIPGKWDYNCGSALILTVFIVFFIAVCSARGLRGKATRCWGISSERVKAREYLIYTPL